MKTLFSLFRLLLFSGFWILFISDGDAQPPVYWVGGTPGMENDWACHRNWSNSRVPNEFSNVIIPDVSSGSQADPVIWDGLVKLNSLTLESNASLCIKKMATLVIFEGLIVVDPLDPEVEGLLLEWEKTRPQPSDLIANSQGEL